MLPIINRIQGALGQVYSAEEQYRATKGKEGGRRQRGEAGRQQWLMDVCCDLSVCLCGWGVGVRVVLVMR